LFDILRKRCKHAVSENTRFSLLQTFQVCDRFVVFSHGEVVKSSTKENTSLDELTDLILAN